MNTIWRFVQIVAFFLVQTILGVGGGYVLANLLMNTFLQPRSMYGSLMTVYFTIAVCVFVVGLVGYHLVLA